MTLPTLEELNCIRDEAKKNRDARRKCIEARIQSDIHDAIREGASNLSSSVWVKVADVQYALSYLKNTIYSAVYENSIDHSLLRSGGIRITLP